jgi:hypothetical protein
VPILPQSCACRDRHQRARPLARRRGQGPQDARQRLVCSLFRAFWALLPSDDWEWERIERILIDALHSDDFITVPKINGPVRAVRLRYGDPIADTPIQNIEGVELFTHSDIVPGNRVLLRLLPPSPDPESALVRFLIVNPDTTREEALKAVRNEFPDFAKRAFDRFWSQARKAASLPARAPPGAKRKQK